MIWNEFSGAGVHVAVYDDGVEVGHEDLDDNYDATAELVDDQGNPLPPTPVLPTDARGTAGAGIIGAELNGIGGVGVAWGVTLTGVRIGFSDGGFTGANVAPDPTAFRDLVLQGQAFDLLSHGWNLSPNYLNDRALQGGGFGDLVEQAYEQVSQGGRDGLGTIIVNAAGNNGLDANGSGLNASRFTITVAATYSSGFVAAYTNYGASILVAAPSAEITTDLSGTDGFDAGNYTTALFGTATAAPVVSGVVALMLQANSGLGWRDVQDILAASATLTRSAFTANVPASASEVGLWSTNAATTWNGGGYHLHASYGYGMVNAFNAVRMAEVWSLFGAAETSANEVLVQSGLNDFADTQVPQITGEFTTTFTMADDVQIDHVALNLSLAALTIGDLVLRLTSADGTTITVANENRFSGGSATTTTWTYGIEGFRGELSAGTWTLTATDAYGGPATTLLSASLDIYGSAPRADDVYHFTDEFLTMLGAQSGRGTITDTNGGQDWLNLAAVTGNVALNLASGQVLTVAGAAWATLAGAFENAVTGDGADTLRGTGVDNALHGMRGDDVISGLGGADRLFGGAGNDIIYGGDGADRISGGAGIDSLYGGAGIDLLNYSGAGSSVVVSLNQGMGFLGDALFDVYSGFERVFGSAFADTLVASDDGTVIRGGGGGDFINGSIGMDRAVYFGSAAGVTVDLSTTLGTGGDAEGDVLIGIEYLTGSAHDDVLIGDAG